MCIRLREIWLLENEQLLYTTLTKFPGITEKRIQRYSGSCEDVPSEAIDKVVGSLRYNHFNDRRH